MLQGCNVSPEVIGGPQDPVNVDPLHFLMVGDWGVDHTADITNQTSVATAMATYLQKWKFDLDALFMLGDNFYGDLPNGVNSSRWKSAFEDMYPASVFDCPAYAVPGNHDYQRAPGSKIDAEFAYAALGTSRWTMPSRYHKVLSPSSGTPLVELFFVDSNMPNERAQPRPPDGSYYTPTDAQRVEQLNWLTAALSQPKVGTYRIVVGHHPLYTNGAHGDNATLIRDWDPLFRANGVDLYLAGHDHDLQHLEFAGHPTSFVSSGGGGAPLNGLHTAYGPYSEKTYGFTHVNLTGTQMIVRHLDITGGLLHKFTRSASDGTVTILK